MYSHGCNESGYSYFTINICNRCIDILKILFGAMSEACFAIVTTIWRPGLSLDSYFWQSNYNWVVDRRNMPVEDLIRSQLQSEEEFTDQRSSHFKLCITVNFKSVWKKSSPSFDLPFGTVMTELKLFQVVERKMMYHARQTFEINWHV